MPNKSLETPLQKLNNTLNRLEEILEQPLEEHDFILDATIQRFEFCIELTWKSLKHLLHSHGIEKHSPRELLQEAYAAGWLSNEKIWLQMMKDRNLTSHTYEHDRALEIYHHIQEYYPEMRKTYAVMESLTKKQ